MKPTSIPENSTTTVKRAQVSSLRPCPVCQVSDKNVLFHQEFSGLSAGSFLHSYDVCACKKCGMGFADGLPDPAEFDRYYAEMSQWEFLDKEGVESPQDAERFETVAQYFIEENLKKDAPVLDVGCATGGMLAAFRRRGFNNLLGLDPSPRCAELALKNYGIHVRTGTVHDLASLPRNLGLVTLSGVLEHFYDPNSALKDIHDLLADDGLFYVNVPDVEGFVQYLDGPYQQFSIEHILYFTSASLINLMKMNGFEAIRVITRAQPYTLTYKYPVIEGIFKKGKPGSWVRDSSPALENYIQASEDLASQVLNQLEMLASNHTPVLVWGVGTNTQRLIAAGQLTNVNVVAFIDSNPHYQGKKLAGIPVLAPAEITKYSQSILIASFIFRQEITQQIRQTLGCNNHLIFLGDS